METDIELTPKEQLIIEASAKITKGQTLILEGKLELKHLLGLAKEKPAKEKIKKTIANRTARLPAIKKSTFKKETRSNEEIKLGIVKRVHVNRSMSTGLIFSKMNLSKRHGERLLQELVSENKLFNKNSGTDRPASWVVVGKERKRSSRKKSKFPTGHGVYLDYDSLSDQVYNFIKNNEWVSKRKLLKGVDCSAAPLNRILEVLKGDGKITVIRKNHNPEHTLPKVYERDADYWVTT